MRASSLPEREEIAEHLEPDTAPPDRCRDYPLCWCSVGWWWAPVFEPASEEHHSADPS